MFTGGDFKLIKKLSSGHVLLLDCKIQLLSTGEGSVPLIACAGCDNNIHLFNIQCGNGELDCVNTMKITGHEDWVRTLAFTVDGTSPPYFSSIFSFV